MPSGMKTLAPTILVAAILLVLSLYLAYSAGYFGTLPGEKGIWKSLYERADLEKKDLAASLAAEEAESEKLRNDSSSLKASIEEWEAKYWQESSALNTLQSHNQQLESQYNDTIVERDHFEALYTDQVRVTQTAEGERDRLSADLAAATRERDNWRSLYDSSQRNLTSFASLYNQKLQELASMKDSRDEWKGLYDSMKESRDEWESSYLGVKSLYDNLTTDYEELEAAHSTLSTDYASLSSQYAYLKTQNSALNSDLNRIRADYSALNSTYILLQHQYNQLNATYGQYAETYSDLNSTYWDLLADYSELNTSYGNLYGLHLSLLNDYNGLLSDYSELEADYESLEEEYESLDKSWEDYVGWYRIRTGLGEDAKRMITPHDPTVSSKSAQILGYSANGQLTWADMNSLHSWVATNIAYNYDTAVWNPYSGTDRFDYWQSPNRTIGERRGDCEDKANLLLSLFLAEQDVGYAYVAVVEFSDGTGHAVVFINVEGDQMFIYDPTWNTAWLWGLLTSPGWTSDGSGSEPAKIAEYEAKAGRSIKLIHAVFNDKTYKSFSTMQEFYDWF